MLPNKPIQALIIDMDGVLWEGNQPLPGLKDFFHLLRQKQLPFVLATNNASLTQAQYVEKLKKMGIEVTPNEILTSSMATAHFLSEQTDVSNKTAFVIGEEGLRQPLKQAGFTLVDTFNKQSPVDYVISGLDRNLNWEKLAHASLYLHHGAQFIATNGDTTLPTENGPVLGNGAIIASLEAASHVSPTIIGKPEPIMYQQIISKLGVKAESTIAIGDRLNTDILGAVNAGIHSILVLTGISQPHDLNKVDYQPTWVLPDLYAVIKALKEA